MSRELYFANSVCLKSLNTVRIQSVHMSFMYVCMFPVILPPITSSQVMAEEQCSVQNVINLSFNGRGLDNKVGVAYTCMCQIYLNATVQ